MGNLIVFESGITLSKTGARVSLSPPEGGAVVFAQEFAKYTAEKRIAAIIPLLCLFILN